MRGDIYTVILDVMLIVIVTVGADWFPFFYVVFHDVTSICFVI